MAGVSRRLLVLVFLASFCVACGPPWVVVTSAAPNPFANQRSFALEPMHFEDLVVGEKYEKDYLEGKDEEQQESWFEDKRAFSVRFGEALAAELPEVELSGEKGASPFVLRPRAMFIEPGFYAVVASRPSEVRMTLEIVDAKGSVLDVIKLRTIVPGTLSNPSSGGRLRQAADILGANAAQYLRTRVFP